MFCKIAVIAVTPHKIVSARHNAEVYGVAHKIKFIVGDFCLEADVLFMSLPVERTRIFAQWQLQPRESMCSNHRGGGFAIFDLAKKIAFRMPKTTDTYKVSSYSN